MRASSFIHLSSPFVPYNGLDRLCLPGFEAEAAPSALNQQLQVGALRSHLTGRRRRKGRGSEGTSVPHRAGAQPPTFSK